MLTNPIAPEKIGFDFDGVIADIGEAFLRIACEEYDYCSFSLEDITSFKVESCTKIPEGIVDKIFKDILADSLATGLQPINGALDVISKLTSRSEVTIITARSLAEPVTDWFANFLPDVICDNINVIAMCDHDQKVRFIEQHNLQYFIDDRAETCAQIAEAGYIPILFRQPWNEQWDRFTTVSNWEQIAAILHC